MDLLDIKQQFKQFDARLAVLEKEIDYLIKAVKKQELTEQAKIDKCVKEAHKKQYDKIFGMADVNIFRRDGF